MDNNLKTFKVKFFGSKNRKTQVSQVKMDVEAESEEVVEAKLRHFYKYEIINGLKIRKS